MGLDMGLGRVAGYDQDGKPIYKDCVQWRKINQVHGWFERRFGEIENGKTYSVSEKILKDLVADCTKVLYSRASDDLLLKKLKNNKRTVRARVLPTTSGFFFGDTTYSDYYYEGLEEVLSDVLGILDNCSERDIENLVYWAWW